MRTPAAVVTSTGRAWQTFLLLVLQLAVVLSLETDSYGISMPNVKPLKVSIHRKKCDHLYYLWRWRL